MSRPKNTNKEIKKTTLTKEKILRLAAFIVISTVVLLVYRMTMTQPYFMYVMIAYMILFAVCVLAYVIYNRGFSRRGLTLDMLPEDWSQEKKESFIRDGEIRLKKSRPLTILIFAFALTFTVDIIELFLVPMVERIFGI